MDDRIDGVLSALGIQNRSIFENYMEIQPLDYPTVVSKLKALR